jgi:hypothetical protein
MTQNALRSIGPCLINALIAARAGKADEESCNLGGQFYKRIPRSV